MERGYEIQKIRSEFSAPKYDISVRAMKFFP